MPAWQYKARQSYVGQLIENNWYIESASASLVDALAFGERIRDFYATGMAPICHENWQLNEVLFREVGATPGTPFVTIPGISLPVVGTDVGATTAPVCTLTLAFKSATGPPWNGYLALGGFSGIHILETGLWSATAQASISGAYTSLDAGIKAIQGDADVVIVSSNSSVVPAGTTAVVDVVIPRDIVGTRRSRKTGRGS